MTAATATAHLIGADSNFHLDDQQRTRAAPRWCTQRHARVALTTIGHEYVVDLIRDLIAVCPNCHATLYRTEPPMAVEVLAELTVRRRGARTKWEVQR